MTPEEVLEVAIEVLERDGWHQGGLHASHMTPENSAHAPACAMGAISRAVWGHASTEWVTTDAFKRDCKAYEGAISRLGNSIGSTNIPRWNDSDSTTKEDVILGFKKAIHHDS